MNPRRFLPALLLLFVGSGCAALIYEIVWFQLLQLVIGSSAISLGVLLGTFMGGMCLGSLLLSRLISARQHPLRVYAVLELGIGVLGLLILFGDAARRRHLHRVGAARGSSASCLRGVVGRHLPAAADDADGRDAAGDLALGEGDAGRRRRGSASSTAATSPAASSAACSPASTCCACTTSPTATFVAVAHQRRRRADRATCWRGQTPYERRRRDARRAPARRPPAHAAVYVAIALSGLTALGVRGDLDAPAVAALRRHRLHLLADPRGVPRRPRHRQQRRRGARRATSRRRARARLVPAAAVRRDRLGGVRAHRVAAVLADQPVARRRRRGSRFQLDLVRCFWVVLPGAILWGASFPLALAAGRPRASRTPPGWSAASTPPTPSARSSARS